MSGIKLLHLFVLVIFGWGKNTFMPYFRTLCQKVFHTTKTNWSFSYSSFPFPFSEYFYQLYSISINFYYYYCSLYFMTSLVKEKYYESFRTVINYYNAAVAGSILCSKYFSNNRHVMLCDFCLSS